MTREREINTTQRLENGIKHQPDRYITVRDGEKNLLEVHDKDSGRAWIRTKNGWIWVD